MRHRIPGYRHPWSVAYLAVGVLVGAGGSYALAATSGKTVVACADRGTRVLHLARHGRCSRRQMRVAWNQRGPQGVPGPAGAPAVSIWATEASNDVQAAGQGLSIAHVSMGTYQVTVTASACEGSPDNAPVVTLVDSSPPVGYGPGAAPVAWTGSGGVGQFTVDTGVISGGAFKPSDVGFDLHDTC